MDVSNFEILMNSVLKFFFLRISVTHSINPPGASHIKKQDKFSEDIKGSLYMISYSLKYALLITFFLQSTFTSSYSWRYFAAALLFFSQFLSSVSILHFVKSSSL